MQAAATGSPVADNRELCMTPSDDDDVTLRQTRDWRAKDWKILAPFHADRKKLCVSTNTETRKTNFFNHHANAPTCIGILQGSALECGDIHGPIDGPYGGMAPPCRYCSDITWPP